MAKKLTEKQTAAREYLKTCQSEFAKNPNGIRWVNLETAMRIYQEAYQNPEGELLTSQIARREMQEVHSQTGKYIA